MKLLITGGLGFIGSNFIRYILNKYSDPPSGEASYEVVNLDKMTYAGNPENVKDIASGPEGHPARRENNSKYSFIKGDICDEKLINDLISKEKPDTIINFAAETHVDRSILEPDAFIKTDILGTHTLLEAVRKYNISRFVQISSLTGDMLVLVKNPQNKIELLTFKELEKKYKQGHSVLSLDKEYKYQFRPVKKFIKHKIRGIYTIFYTGGYIKTSASHSVFLFDKKSGEIILKEVKDINEGDFLVTLLGNNKSGKKDLIFNLNNYKRGTNYAPYSIVKFAIDKDLMWCFGFYLAEGHCFTHKIKKTKKITLAQKFPDDLLKFSEILYKKFGFKFPVRERKDKTGFRMEITRQPICRFFSDFGGNAYTKKLPYWIWEMNSDFIKSFLAGYEGDAYIRPDKARNYTSINENLIIQLAWLCRLNNINCRINQRICKNNQGLFIGSKKRDIKMYDLVISSEEFVSENDKFRTPFARCLPIKPDYPSIETKNNNIAGKQKLESVGIDDPIISGDIGVAKITKIQYQDKEVKMYDLEVLGTQSFFSGIVPVLAHNTDEVYGSIEKGKFIEQSPLKPNSPYSASKTGADLLVRAYFKTYGLPVLITRSSNNYGFYQYPEKMIPLFITNLIEDKKVPLYGDGLNVRDWIYVLDNCEGIDVVLHKGKEGEIYNIGADNEKTNKEITEIILKELGKDKTWIEHVKDRPGHDKRYALDSTKIKKLGWKPKHSFEKAIKQTIEWYKNNQDWWKKIKSGEFLEYYKKQYP